MRTKKQAEFSTKTLPDRWISKCHLCTDRLVTLKREGEFTKNFRLAQHAAYHNRF